MAVHDWSARSWRVTGASVAWWRVVRADGSLPPSHGDEARQAYLEEGTPLRPSGSVDLTHAFWEPSLGAQ